MTSDTFFNFVVILNLWCFSATFCMKCNWIELFFQSETILGNIWGLTGGIRTVIYAPWLRGENGFWQQRLKNMGSPLMPHTHSRPLLWINIVFIVKEIKMRDCVQIRCLQKTLKTLYVAIRHIWDHRKKNLWYSGLCNGKYQTSVSGPKSQTKSWHPEPLRLFGLRKRRLSARYALMVHLLSLFSSVCLDLPVNSM